MVIAVVRNSLNFAGRQTITNEHNHYRLDRPGELGTPMSQRLINAGYPVAVYNRNKDKETALRSRRRYHRRYSRTTDRGRSK